MQPVPDTPSSQELEAFSKASGSVVMVINSDIDSQCKDEVARLLSEIGSQERLMVLVESPGGSIEDAFWIAKELRMWCQQLDVAVTGWAKSATTLIALAADRILFGPYGQLGPLDVQLRDFSGGAGPISPLETIRGMEFLRNYYLETFHHFMDALVPPLDVPHAIEHTPKLLAPIATPLYQMIDYRQLGDAFRRLLISETYARSVMLRWSPLKDDRALIDKVIRKLVWEYPYHGYIIDFDECQNIGIRNADQMTLDMSMLCQQIITVPEPPTITVLDGEESFAIGSLTGGLEDDIANGDKE